MNRQAVFNTVYTKLREQGKRSVDATGQCMYRAPDGAKCAIGHLIPDELYKGDMEGSSTYSEGAVADALRQVFGELTDKDFEFFMHLQHAHDDWYADDDVGWATSSVYILNEKMRQVAEKFNLEFNYA